MVSAHAIQRVINLRADPHKEVIDLQASECQPMIAGLAVFVVVGHIRHQDQHGADVAQSQVIDPEQDIRLFTGGVVVNEPSPTALPGTNAR